MKTIQKLSALVLSLSLLFSLSAVSAAGTQIACYATLSDTTWNFSESTEVKFYTLAQNETSGTSVDNTASVTLESKEQGSTDKALRFFRGKSSSKNVGGIMYLNDSNPISDALTMKYSFKIEAVAAQPFYCYYRNNSNVKVVEYNNGKIKFLGKEIATYEADTWYDVKMVINLKENYGRFSIKKQTENEYKPYDVFCINDTSFNSITTTTRLAFGFEGGSVNNAFWLDNYYHNYATVDEYTPTLSCYSDDFESEGTYIPQASYKGDYIGEWMIQNESKPDNKETTPRMETTFKNDILTGVEGKVAVVESKGIIQAYPTMGKRIDFTSTPNLVHQFTFQIGGTKSGTKSFGLNFKKSDGGNEAHNLLEMSGGSTLKLGGVQRSDFGAITEKKLYNCKVTFDDKINVAYVSVWNEAGKQLTETVDLSSHTSALQGAYFTNPTSADSTMYIDNFTWDIYNGGEETVGVPTLAGNKVSCNVSGYRFEHESPMLLVALYDEASALSKVLTTSTFTDGTAEVSLESETYSTAKAYVWTNDLKPLREVTDFTASN